MREERALDEGEIGAGVVFLPLADHELFIGEIAHHRPRLEPQLTHGGEAPVAIGDLITPFRFRMGTHKDRHLLAVFANLGNEALLLLFRHAEPVRNEGAVDQRRVEIDDRLPLRQLSFQIGGALRLFIDAAQRLRESSDRTCPLRPLLEIRQRADIGIRLLGCGFRRSAGLLDSKNILPRHGLFSPPCLFHKVFDLDIDRRQRFQRPVIGAAGELVAVDLV